MPIKALRAKAWGMVVNHRWQRYVLGGCAACVLVCLVVVADTWTADRGTAYISQEVLRLPVEATNSTEGTTLASSADDAPASSADDAPASSADDAPASSADDAPASSADDAPATRTTSEAPSTIAKDTLRYMHRPGFVIENADLCRGNGSSLSVLILVTSAPDHDRHRMAVRYTWGHFSARRSVAIGFVLGAVENAERQRLVQGESDEYGDIIQSQDVDGYRRLPLKTLSLLQWTDAHCPGAPFVLKTDDDMFINVPALLDFARGIAGERNAIFGLLAKGWKPVRSRSSKYRVTQEEFPGGVLPDFTTGPAYLMTGDVVPRLHQAALDRPFLPLEDVLFTGLVAGDLGIRKVHNPKFHPGLKSSQSDDCKRQNSISIHDVKYETQFVYWSRLLDGKHKC